MNILKLFKKHEKKCEHPKRISGKLNADGMRAWTCMTCEDIEFCKPSEFDTKFLQKHGQAEGVIALSKEESYKIKKRINDEMEEFRRKNRKKMWESEQQAKKLYLD